MLQKQAVPDSLLAILEPVGLFFSQHMFYLAGGTALALRLGHRLSVDLDFFTPAPFSVEALEAEMIAVFPEIQVISKTRGSICAVINGVKVEAFHYPTETLEATELVEGVCYASLEDNAGMKLSALVNRGTKKDFTDVCALLEVFSLKQLLALYDQKYPNSNSFMLLTSLTYFTDAEKEADPVFLTDHTWEKVKNKITQAVQAL